MRFSIDTSGCLLAVNKVRTLSNIHKIEKPASAGFSVFGVMPNASKIGGDIAGYGAASDDKTRARKSFRPDVGPYLTPESTSAVLRRSNNTSTSGGRFPAADLQNLTLADAKLSEALPNAAEPTKHSRNDIETGA